MGKIYYKDVSYGGGGSSTLDGSIVGVEQVQRSGNLIAVISVDEDDTNIYSPLPPLIDVDVNDVSVLDSVTQTAKVYTHKSLTKAEYEAIPSSISHVNNIIYAITDEPKLYLNGIEYNGTGGGQTSVIVSPIATEGTKIASISVDGIINDIYAPNGGDEYVSGDNIIISTFAGQPSTISAVDTTYSAFTSTAAGLVPPPTTAVDMFLKSDGTWSEAGVGNVVDVYENGVSVLDENNIAQTHSYKEITQAEYDALYPPGSTVTDNILYAIKDGEGGSGGGGASDLDDLGDVNISSPSNGQVLTYNSASSKWVNANASGGGGGVSYGYTIPSSAGTDGQLYMMLNSSDELKAMYLNMSGTWTLIDGNPYDPVYPVLVASVQNTDSGSSATVNYTYSGSETITTDNFLHELTSYYFSGSNKYICSTNFTSYVNNTLTYEWTSQSGSTCQWFDIYFVEDLSKLHVLSSWTTYDTDGEYTFTLPSGVTAESVIIDFKEVNSGGADMERASVLKSQSGRTLKIKFPFPENNTQVSFKARVLYLQ